MSEFVVVEAKCGPLQGSVVHSHEGYDYCAFKGVPYAEPPVGSLRFKDPVPIAPWKEVRDATKFGSDCAQYDIISKTLKGEDDCLYLNIYVKSIKPSARLPVMVWIHGGAFMMGSGDDSIYGPDYFLKKDVILVTLNYRVGVLGFLNFDDEAAFGNQGLKDQVMALRWVNENIVHFGGNPSNVTIFGESAGGASINFLALSPLTKGLIHKAISQSGVACNPWALNDITDTSYELCKILGNDSKDPKELVEFLRTIDHVKLIEAQNQVMNSNGPFYRTSFPFGPVVDSKSPEPFMPVHPTKAMQNGIHIPYIFGYTSCEGIFFLMGLKDKHYDEMDQSFHTSIKRRTLKALERHNITPSHLRSMYFGNEKISMENRAKFAALLSDVQFIEGIHRAVKCQVQRSSTPTYLYRFSYDKGVSMMKTMFNVNVPGVAHGEEMQYQFFMKMFDKFKMERPKPGSTTYMMIERMVEMWVNFAKYGRPTTEVSELIPTYWLPVTDEDNFQILDINENLQMQNVENIEIKYRDFSKMSNL